MTGHNMICIVPPSFNALDAFSSPAYSVLLKWFHRYLPFLTGHFRVAPGLRVTVDLRRNHCGRGTHE
jgi:hypothetical protein